VAWLQYGLKALPAQCTVNFHTKQIQYMVELQADHIFLMSIHL